MDESAYDMVHINLDDLPGGVRRLVEQALCKAMFKKKECLIR